MAAAWHAARERRATELDEIEGAGQNASSHASCPPSRCSPGNGGSPASRT